MGRGQPPKPTRLKLIQGNPGGRPVNAKEAVLAAEIPQQPDNLSAEARKHWARNAPLLGGCGLLTPVDGDMFAVYCEALARMWEAMEHIRAEGAIVVTATGYPIQSPWCSIMKEAQGAVHRFGVEFGLSPASRSRVVVDDRAKQDDFDEFLSRGKK